MRRTFQTGAANDQNQCIGYCIAWVLRLKQYGRVSSIGSLGGRAVAGVFSSADASTSTRGQIIRAGLSLERNHETEDFTAIGAASEIRRMRGYYILNIFGNRGGHSVAVRYGLGHPDLFFDPNRGQWEGDDLLVNLVNMESLLQPTFSAVQSGPSSVAGVNQIFGDIVRVS
jgi:hypothetical protein